MANFAEDLERQARADAEADDTRTYLQGYEDGRDMERLQRQANRLMAWTFCAFCGFAVGLLAAAVMHAIWH